jgi:hypothetical protein
MGNGIDAIFCIKNFYTLESLKLVVDMNLNYASKAQERLLRDIIDYEARYISNLKRALYDYTALVAFGEMRHAYDKSTYLNPDVPEGGGRNTSYKVATQYNPTSILIAGEKLFSKRWSGSYGGEKWRNICNRVLLKDKINDAVYIDMCFSLTHNCSPYLDKSESNIFRIWNVSEYKRTLDFKFNEINPMKVISFCSIYAGKHLKKLVTRAIILGIVPEWVQENVNSYYDKKQWNAEDYILNYQGLEWGNEWMQDKPIEHRRSLECEPFELIPKNAFLNSMNIGDILEALIDVNYGYRTRFKKGMKAKIIAIRHCGKKIEVEFRKNVNGHDLCGKCKNGYGLCVDATYFKKVGIA